MVAGGVLVTVFVIAGNTLLRPLVDAIHRAPIREQASEAIYEVGLATDPDSVPEAREMRVEPQAAAQYPVSDVDVVEHGDTTMEVVGTWEASTRD